MNKVVQPSNRISQIETDWTGDLTSETNDGAKVTWWPSENGKRGKTSADYGNTGVIMPKKRFKLLPDFRNLRYVETNERCIYKKNV